MKWVNHVLIAGAVTAVYDVRLVPSTIVGATAPDWMVPARKTKGGTRYYDVSEPATQKDA